MKKFNLFILFSLMFFIFSKSAYAGICNGKENLSTDGYCYFGYGYNFNNVDYSGNNHYYSVFQITSSTMSGSTESAFCLDPNKERPQSTIYHARELNVLTCISEDGFTGCPDLNIYKIYQKYVNAYANDSSNNKTYLRNVDSSLRYIVSQNGWAQGFDYTESMLSSSGASNFYNDAVNINMWRNPLNILITEDYDDDSHIHTFNFEIKFTNSTSQYFYQNNNNLINGDYDIGFGEAYFRFKELEINGGAYSLSNSVDGIKLNGDIISIPKDEEGFYKINKYSNNPNATINISLSLTDDIYNSIKEQDPNGKVYVSMYYETYNPMSDENVFIAKLFNNYNGSYQYEGTTQRMVVFSKYITRDTASSDDSINSKMDVYYYCKQEGNKFYYNNTQVELSNYIPNCSCDNVDYDKLSDVNKATYNNSCGGSPKIEVINNLKTCGTNISSDDNTIKYIEEQFINRFCTLNCSENIKFNGMTEYFSTWAGRYFELNDKLKVDFTKNCTMDIKYSVFDNDYKNLLTEQIKAYNDWQQDLAISNASPTYEDIGNNRTRVRYHYSYTRYFLRNDFSIGNELSIGVVNSKSSAKPAKKYAIFVEKTAKLDGDSGIFNKLDICNDYLKNKNDFYNVSNNNFKFYYYQTILKKQNNGSYKDELLKNNKMDIDDSSLEPTPISNGEKGNYSTYVNKSVNYLNSTGISSRTLGYEGNNLYREQNYIYEYTPTVPKYVDSYTGIIGNISGKNKISLGNGYNILINAITNSANDNYYYFEKLGDNGIISDYYKEKGRKNEDGELQDLIRRCTYGIENEMFECEIGECPNNKKPSMNPVFRIVDSNNIDPNGRLEEGQTDSNGFRNWRDKKGLATKETIENADTYNPNNLEYSFTLDSATIKAIREYNKNVSYFSTDNTSKLECNSAGNECTSTFITEAMKSNPKLFNVEEPIKRFATNNDGSNKWRYLDYSDRDGYYIHIFEKGKVDYESLKSKLSSVNLNP